MKNKLGVASGFFKEPSGEKWRSLAEAGFSEIELGLSRELPAEEILESAQSILADCRAAGLNVSSVHIPFGGEWDVSALDEPRHAFATDNVKDLLDWTADQGIRIAVLHPSYEPIKESARPARLERAAGSIRVLGGYAKSLGITLAVENLPRTCLGNCADEMLALTGNGEYAGICFDVNHLLMEPHREFYPKIAPYTVTAHLSDYDRVNERHWAPGEGCIDWRELIGMFEKAGYAGRLIFECNESAAVSLNRVLTPRELLERFKRVAGQL